MTRGTSVQVMTRHRKTRVVLVAIAWFAMLSLAGVVRAHPVHITIAQMRHNTDTSALEIAMQINARSLEEAIELRTSEPVDLEKTEGIDELVHGYLADVFFVRTGDTDKYASTGAHTLVWIGFELEDEYAWLYFEVAVPNGIDGLFVANVVLFEAEPEQANTINLRAGEFRTSLRSTASQPWSQIELPETDD